MHVVRAHYHHGRARSQNQIRYISHREEQLPSGQRRELFGFGGKYREMSREIRDHVEFERAVKREFLRHAGNQRRPVFHQHLFTVDDRAARRLAVIDPGLAEQRLRTALARRLRASATGRQLQRVYAIHWHGGGGRPAHPHIPSSIPRSQRQADRRTSRRGIS